MSTPDAESVPWYQTELGRAAIRYVGGIGGVYVGPPDIILHDGGRYTLVQGPPVVTTDPGKLDQAFQVYLSASRQPTEYEIVVGEVEPPSPETSFVYDAVVPVVIEGNTRLVDYRHTHVSVEDAVAQLAEEKPHSSSS